MSAVRVVHFSDTLCVWAYVAQVRLDELVKRFPGQVELETRFLNVFGNARGMLEARWAGKGGADAYAAHVRTVAEKFDHVSLHPEVWSGHTPYSSMPSHLMLCAVRLLEDSGAVGPGTLQRAAWTIREMFFAGGADISRQSVLLQAAEADGLPLAQIEQLLASGEAQAALCEDLIMARDESIRASPTILFNEGRQRLTGNVGYRIIEANVLELVKRPAHEFSWC